MKTRLFDPKRHSVTGPGGWNCPCCGPSPRYRKLYAKLYKRKINRFLDKYFKEL